MIACRNLGRAEGLRIKAGGVELDLRILGGGVRAVVPRFRLAAAYGTIVRDVSFVQLGWCSWVMTASWSMPRETVAASWSRSRR